MSGTNGTYIEAQSKWLADNGILPGSSRVFIMNSAPRHSGGWENWWTEEMSRCVGCFGTVISVCDVGIRVQVDFVEGSCIHRYVNNYPYFVLKAVPETLCPIRKPGRLGRLIEIGIEDDETESSKLS